MTAMMELRGKTRGEMALVFVLFLTICRVHADETLSFVCQGAQSCQDCITVNPACAWCETDTFTGPRCDIPANLAGACANITNPEATASLLENRDLSLPGAPLESIVQVKPQRIKLSVRPREPITVRLYIRQAEDYPVDLYYAMDLSYSMRDDLENLKTLGSALAAELGEITRDYRLGFGSFVDKTVLPYVNTAPEALISPCSGCASPHGFHNILPLTPNATLFASRVRNTSVSGNLDTPEGGFDALMQIAVCQDEIGWRPMARRIVIFTTDAPFHFAGDGRLGGIVQQNDGKCHMDPDTNMYTASNLQDYPSIGHLAAKFQENNIVPIFAVTDSELQYYEFLPNYIEGATIGALESDSGNIVNLTRDNYDRITSQVRLTSTAPDDVTLSYTANCLDGDVFEGSNECSGLSLGDTVAFDITITAERCLEGGTTSFTVGPVGFEEELAIELEVTCECPCQMQGEVNSTFCSNGEGSLVCGECECNTGRYGSRCECSGNELDLGSTDTSMCRTDNTSTVCSGRGECICGSCVCDNTGIPGEVISGQFCECDNFNCPYSKGLRCGGEGTCICDIATRQPKCLCNEGFEGESCNCPTRTDTCRARNGLECNAQGICECGACRCFSESNYQGSTCEKCLTCPVGECHVYRDCVECKWFGTGSLSPEECDMCYIDLINVTSIEEYTLDNPPCTFSQDSACSFSFALVYENETLTIYVESEARCVEPQITPPLTPGEIRWIVIGIILGIVLIGLIVVLIWRVYTHLLDKREYTRWTQECTKASWSVNESGIYKAPTSHHINPLYPKNDQ